MANGKNITLIVADDHSLFRSGIASLLSGEPEIIIIAEAANGEELIEKYLRVEPDVLLVDIQMPVLNGTRAVAELKKQFPDIKALFLSMYDGEEYIYHCLKVGGLGLINKNIMKGELIYAIRQVYNGQKYFGRQYNDDMLNDIYNKYENLKASLSQNALVKFTPREEEVLKFISRGLTSSEIAAQLGVSKRTIDSHRFRLIQKLDLNSLPDLIKYAIQYEKIHKS